MSKGLFEVYELYVFFFFISHVRCDRMTIFEIRFNCIDCQVSPMGSATCTSAPSPSTVCSMSATSMAAMPSAAVTPSANSLPGQVSRGHHHGPQPHSGHLGGVWGQAVRSEAAPQYSSPAPAHGSLSHHHARFAFQVGI